MKTFTLVTPLVNHSLGFPGMIYIIFLRIKVISGASDAERFGRALFSGAVQSHQRLILGLERRVLHG